MLITKSQHKDGVYRTIAVLLFLISLVVVIFTFQDYGISSDEGLRARYGKAVLSYYTSGFVDTTSQSMGVSSYYGGIFDVIAAVIIQVSPLDEFDTRKLLGGLVGLLGILGCYKLGALIGGGRAGLLSAILLALIPVYWGSMFFNPKDIPFAVGYIWTLFCLVRWFHKPSNKFLDAISFGVALGVTLAVKIVGVVLALPVLVAGTFFVGRGNTSEPLTRRDKLATFAKFLIFSGIIAYPIMIIFWPWSHLDPILGPLKALNEFSSFPGWKNEVVLFGNTYPWNRIPWTYLPTYFLVQLPEIILTLLVMGIWFGIQTIGNLSRPLRQHHLDYIILLVAVLFPVLAAMLKGSVIYNGVRHFIFCIPIIAVFAGGAFNRCIELISADRFRSVFAAIVILYMICHVYTMVLLHPYQYTFFNSAVGGLAGAHKSFETDYWATSYREAVSTLKRYIDVNSRDGSSKEHTVAICGPAIAAKYYLPASIKAVQMKDDPQYIIGYLRGKCANMPGVIVASVSRMGAPLTVIRQVR